MNPKSTEINTQKSTDLNFCAKNGQNIRVIFTLIFGTKIQSPLIDPESTKINIQKSTILNFSPKLLKRTYNFKIDFWRENSYNFDLVTKIIVVILLT